MSKIVRQLAAENRAAAYAAARAYAARAARADAADARADAAGCLPALSAARPNVPAMRAHRHAARERRLLETPTMTKAQLSIVFALAAWPAVALAEGLFFGVTGLPLFSPVEGAVFTRVFLALGFAVVAGTAYREYSS